MDQLLEQQDASFLREDAARSERWKHLTEGEHEIKDMYQRRVVETLMDNTLRLMQGQLPGAVNEETTTQSIATFNRVAYPMIRRIYPGLVANELVSIQPMKLPVTLVFFLDFKYGTTQSPTVAGHRTDYEAGQHNRFYSAGVIRDEALGTGDGNDTTFNTDYYPLRSGSETVYKNSVVVAPADYTIDYTSGLITFDTAPANGVVCTVDYALIQEGLGSQGNSHIPEIELDMSSAQVGATGRKIKAKWTLEAQQDLRAYHGLSAETELVSHMSEEVKREIDREIINDLLDAATAGNVNWSKTIPSGVTKKDHYETLMHAIADVSNEIYKKRFRQANFVIMSPDTLNMLDKINTFRAIGGFDSDGNTRTSMIASGPGLIGTLGGRYKVIVDPLFSNDKILVGFKGDSWTETGYVHSPYVAFQTETFMDPNTMKPVKGLMTRYGRHVVNGDFYGTVTVLA